MVEIYRRDFIEPATPDRFIDPFGMRRGIANLLSPPPGPTLEGYGSSLPMPYPVEPDIPFNAPDIARATDEMGRVMKTEQRSRAYRQALESPRVRAVTTSVIPKGSAKPRPPVSKKVPADIREMMKIMGIERGDKAASMASTARKKSAADTRALALDEERKRIIRERIGYVPPTPAPTVDAGPYQPRTEIMRKVEEGLGGAYDYMTRPLSPEERSAVDLDWLARDEAYKRRINEDIQRVPPQAVTAEEALASGDPLSFLRNLPEAIKPQGPYASGGTGLGQAIAEGGQRINDAIGGAYNAVSGLFSDAPSAFTQYFEGGEEPATPAETPPGETPPGGAMPPSEGADAERVARQRAAAEGQPVAEAETDIYQKYLEDMIAGSQDLTFEDALAQIDKTYGNVDYANPKQDAADAYAAREHERTAALAQLALAAGMVSGAGKSWEGLGEGFGAAAGVYGKGFERYQNALQDSATRYDDRVQQQQTFDLAKRKAALDMYTTNRTDRRTLAKELIKYQSDAHKEARKEAQSLAKETRDGIDTQFKEMFKVAFPEGSIDDEDTQRVKMSKYMRAWTESLKRGRFIDPEVLDKASRVPGLKDV